MLLAHPNVAAQYKCGMRADLFRAHEDKKAANWLSDFSRASPRRIEIHADRRRNSALWPPARNIAALTDPKDRLLRGETIAKARALSGALAIPAASSAGSVG